MLCSLFCFYVMFIVQFSCYVHCSVIMLCSLFCNCVIFIFMYVSIIMFTLCIYDFFFRGPYGG